ncbi:histidine phosphotransferase [Oceanicola sp. D3]|uniref:histidine phosphotransferase family protein n=1 Tax=Oceanicola sp. D3 TaxID=2587163 RepID=UPI00111CC203|nr:histidine phosphotransferase family protein [Oceanicola sp. D3]QDC09628.1 histidine phosphotransferase [Oceanicola sp. D3]
MDDDFDLAARLASRICHDLISPVGAIGNGVELLAMAGLQNSPELALVDDSVKNAQGRIKFFRIAFGRAEEGQAVSEAEILATLADYLGGGRVQVDWPAPGTVGRAELRAIFLAINCLEIELAYGGVIEVRPSWEVVARAPRLRNEAAAWEALERGDGAGLSPAQLQFAMLPKALAALGRAAEVARLEEEVAIRF